ncbi:Adenylate kinase 5 [Diplonema papillatum]|nr:Adenylate kinase 5 [Diplonema papillatum]
MSRMRHSTKPLPKDDEYLHVHQMPYFLEALQDRLRTEKPDDPLEFVDRFVKSVPKPKLVIKGPPASGKGTQCEKLVRHLGVVHISTGDLLRTEVKNGTSVGKQVAAFMKDGSLVPDELVIAIVKKRLSEPDARQHGWLLDGFPRTAVQARMMRDEGIVPQAVMKLEVSREEVVSRIAGRRVDPATNKVYHATHRPPPPGVKVIQRPDDTAEAIVKRYDTYMQNANEVLKEYSCPIYAIEGGTEDVAAAQILSKYQKLRWTKLLNSKRSKL